jgi:hypothetical protein
MEITRKQLIDALGDLIDGDDENDIRYNTGLSIKRCKEIMLIYDNIKSEYLK